LSTGLQISGIFSSVIEHEGKPIYTNNWKNSVGLPRKELVGTWNFDTPRRFGSPIGKLEGINLAIEDMSPKDLNAYDILESKTVKLEFEGGIVEGEIVTGSRNLQGEITLIRFKNCTVTHGKTVLFQPEWGVYDMAVGKKVTSALQPM
jgi:phenylalanine-4-hydroxylase